MRLLQVMKSEALPVRADIWLVCPGRFRVDYEDQANPENNGSVVYASVDEAVEGAEIFVYSAEFCARRH